MPKTSLSAELPLLPHKKPRVDKPMEKGRLSTPVLFTAVRPTPRTYMIKQGLKKRPEQLQTSAAHSKKNIISLKVPTVKDEEESKRTEEKSAKDQDASTDKSPVESDSGLSSSTSSSAGPIEDEVVELPRAPSVISLDEYLTWVGNTYYTAPELGTANKEWSLVRRTTLGGLSIPGLHKNISDKWSPAEVARFEAAICTYGKLFTIIAKAVGTKTANECIEFFYDWKTTKNYASWKATYPSSLAEKQFEGM